MWISVASGGIAIADLGGSGSGTSGAISAGGGVDGVTAATAGDIGSLVIVWCVILRCGWVGRVARWSSRATCDYVNYYGAEISAGGLGNVGLGAEVDSLIAGGSAGSAGD